MIGLAVLLHFLGDVVEHPLQLTVAGPGSARLGLGLWLCLCATQTLPRGRRAGAAVRFLAVAAVAVAGQAASQAPPDPRANAAFWIVGPVVLALAARRLDRSASATPPP